MKTRKRVRGTLLRTIRALLLDMSPQSADVSYHHHPKRKQPFCGEIFEGFRVQFENDDYFVLLNFSKTSERFEVFLGHARGRNYSGNNADISFSGAHFDTHFLLAVKPSLKRCPSKVLALEPQPIGNFPARVLGTNNHFLVGYPDAQLFPRLFRLCNAKKCSIPN